MRERFRRRSIRLDARDYARPGAYFVTMVVHRRRRLLARVVAGRSRPTAAGRLVLEAWHALPARFPTVRLDAFVVMPDHVHGIVWIEEEPDPRFGGAPGVEIGVGAALVAAHRANPPPPVPTSPPAATADDAHRDARDASYLRDGSRRAATRAAPTSAPRGAPHVAPHPPRRAALGDVVGAFKSLTTVAYFAGVRAHGWPSLDRRLWQRDYFERVIRGGTALATIRAYIAANPARWPG